MHKFSLGNTQANLAGIGTGPNGSKAFLNDPDIGAASVEGSQGSHLVDVGYRQALEQVDLK